MLNILQNIRQLFVQWPPIKESRALMNFVHIALTASKVSQDRRNSMLTYLGYLTKELSRELDEAMQKVS